MQEITSYQIKKKNTQETIILGPKYQFPSSPKRKMNLKQLKTKKTLEKMFSNGEMEFISVPCPCGNSADIVLATSDGFGIWVRTVICQNCGLIRSDPQLTADSLSKFYTEYYQDFYAGYSTNYQTYHQGEKRKGKFLYEYIRRHSNFSKGKVLDIGTMTGGMLEIFKKKGCYCIGIDLNKESINYGRRMGLDLRFHDFLKDDLEEKFDLIFLSHVFEHIQEIKEFASRLNSSLNEGGLLFIEVPGVFSIHRKFFNDPRNYFQMAHIYSFTLESLSEIIENQGFRRIYGTEHVRALFVRDDSEKGSSNKINHALAEREIGFFKWIDTPLGELYGKIRFIANKMYFVTLNLLGKLHLNYLQKFFSWFFIKLKAI